MISKYFFLIRHWRITLRILICNARHFLKKNRKYHFTLLNSSNDTKYTLTITAVDFKAAFEKLKTDYTDIFIACDHLCYKEVF